MTGKVFSPDYFIKVGKWHQYDRHECKLCGWSTINGKQPAIQHVIDIHFMPDVEKPQKPASSKILLVDHEGKPLTEFSRAALNRYVVNTDADEVLSDAENGVFDADALLEAELSRTDFRHELVEALRNLTSEGD